MENSRKALNLRKTEEEKKTPNSNNGTLLSTCPEPRAGSPETPLVRAF